MTAQQGQSPRKRGRPRGFDASQSLEAAMRSFWANGYDGASVDTLCRVTGMSRASLYHDYGGKEGLFLAAIGHYAETRIARVVSSLGPGGTMAEDLAAFFEAVVELATSEPDALGCLVSCVLTDAAGSNEVFRDELGRRMQALEEHIAHRLALADWPEDAQIPAGTAAGLAAVAAHGIMVRARSGQSPAYLRRIATAAVSALCQLSA